MGAYYYTTEAFNELAIIWDLDEDEEGNVQHIAEHGIEKDDVAHVFDHPVGGDTSDSSQRPMVFGYTLDGRYITVIYEQIDDDTVYPVTAFEVPEPVYEQIMAKEITRDRKLTPEEAAKYRKIREEVELEKPEIIAKAQQARCEARRQQLAAGMR